MVSKLKLLIVDDDRAILNLIMAQIAYSGRTYDVSCVGDVSAIAHEIESLGGLDILLVDIALPGSDGFEVRDRLLHQFPETPVIFTSGFVDQDRKQRMGDAPFLKKPFTSKQLCEVLEWAEERLREKAAKGAISQSTELVPPAMGEVKENQGFSGFVHDIRLFDILQMYLMSHVSGRLAVTNPDGQKGWIQLDRGKVIDAAHDQLSGEAAVYDFFTWECGHFFFVKDMAANQITIDKTWDTLLLNAAFRADAGRAEPQEILKEG